MLLRVLHAIASRPRIYDLIQNAAGARRTRTNLSRYFRDLSDDVCVIDAGGGTGAMLPYLPSKSRYICLDLDSLKLHGFRARAPRGMAVPGSAAQAPFRSESADCVLVIAVCHHLTEQELDDMLREIRWLLKPYGRLVLLDPVSARHRVASRILWALDRGSYPRTAQERGVRINAHLRIIEEDHSAIFHQYFAAVAAR